MHCTGHCDLVHAVEAEHSGKNDSVVLYIPAVPFTVAKCDSQIYHQHALLTYIRLLQRRIPSRPILEL